VLRSDLGAFFSLSVADLHWVRSYRSAANRLGLAVSLCGLRYLGFIPDDVTAAPPEVVERLSRQVGVSPKALPRYAAEVDGRLRRLHVASATTQAGWRLCGRGDWKRLGDWLVDRAVEHDSSQLLFRQLLEHLRSEHIVRPGIDRLLRSVGSARVTALKEINWRWRGILTPERCSGLDALIETDPDLGVAPMVWLDQGAVSSSPPAIKAEAAKLAYLLTLGADRLDLSAVPPERVRQFGALARRLTPKALRDMAPERRYPILLATLASMYASVVDELVQMFDQALTGTDSRARQVVAGREAAYVEANIERLDLLDEILVVALDEDLDDAAVGAGVRGLGRQRLSDAQRCDEERLGSDGGHLELMEASFSHVRSFAPQVLGALSFKASVSPSEVLDATKLLQDMNAKGRRHVPGDAPVGFVPPRWQPYLRAARSAGDENSYKHYWEICVLFALQVGLRSGEIWVDGSRRYADPASYLIPPKVWADKREEMLAELPGVPATFAEALARIDEDMARYLDDLEALLADPNSPIRLDENGELHLSPLTAGDSDPVVDAEKKAVLAPLPMVPVAEIMVLVDAETGFTDCLTPAGDIKPRAAGMEHRRYLYIAILSEACNFGPTRMAELTGVSVDIIDWYIRWYLSDEVTRKAANTAIVNVHHRQVLAEIQGGGSLSSSDGVRLPTRGKSLTARALSRYFVDEGITSYTHISDEMSIFGTQIIVSTDRDGLYALDGILGNTTELPLLEHATDTHGQLLVTFAMFNLVGKQLSPRIAKLTEKPLWRGHPASHYARWPLAGPLLANHAQVDVIDERWDDLLRVGASLKLGYVSAALLVSRLQAGSRQHPLAKALLEYGKLLRTLHALRWFTDEAYRRRIGRQLNKGESVNRLRRFLAYAQAGVVLHRHHEDQLMQADCLTIVTNACLLSTTWYIQDAIDAREAAGHAVSDEAKLQISFAHFEAINPDGSHTIDIAAILKRGGRRPLRRAR
jgi:TnpA family transposase